MSAANMLGRVAKMEGGRRGVVVAWKYSGDTSEQALARWRAKHPGEDPDRAGLKVLLISWLDTLTPRARQRVSGDHLAYGGMNSHLTK